MHVCTYIGVFELNGMVLSMVSNSIEVYCLDIYVCSVIFRYILHNRLKSRPSCIDFK